MTSPIDDSALPVSQLAVSVVIPVYNAAAHLEQCLRALSDSTVPPLETIVVDDASTDGSPAVARAYGARLLSTSGRTGPAGARNLGARDARGAAILFLDSDVCVRPDAIAHLVAHFADPSIDAVIGSYDDAPGARNYLSQYRNLMHCFVHQTANRAACTFWSGCGAVRRDVFIAHGGFNESYRRPAIEDIELGARMVRSGSRIVLDPAVQAKHLKRWTFWNMVKTDVRDRGIPWTELILRQRRMPNDLNLKTSQRISVALIVLAVALGAAALIEHTAAFATPVLALLFVLLSGYWVPEHSWGTSLAAGAVFVTIVGFAYGSAQWPLIPALAAAWVALYVWNRYGAGSNGPRRSAGVLYAVCACIACAVSLVLLPRDVRAVAFLAILLTVAAINHRFYRFIAARRGLVFAGAAIPLHFFHYLHSGLSLLLGTAKFVRGGGLSRRRLIDASRQPADHMLRRLGTR